jgi:DNA-binding CsgD family transcriptional regulator
MRGAARLIGRDTELAALDDERGRSAAGELRCVLLTADAGVGKTRLATEFLARNRARCITLSARGSRLADTASFGLWVEAFERRLRGAGRAEVRRACEGALDDLAVLLHPVVTARGGAPPPDPPRARLLQAIAVLVDNLSRAAPVLLLFDDAQLGDSSSWHALNHVGRTLEDRPVLVIVASRPGELAAQELAADVLVALEQDGRLSRLALEPLDGRAVRELAGEVLGRPPPPELVAWLTDRALGNPLFVVGLLEGLLAKGADLSTPALDAVPPSLSDAIASRVRPLQEPAQALVDLLAVAGRSVELPDLPPQPPGTLEALGRSGLVTTEERAHTVALEIAHPLIQDALYERIDVARRRALHRRVGRALLAAGRPGDAALHFARGADRGDAEAVEALRTAMRQAERRASYHEALTILDALVQLLPAGDARWADVLDDMAWRAEWVVDHRADALAEQGVPALRAIEAALGPSGDTAGRAAVSFRLASFLGWGAGDLVEAERSCDEARRLFVLTDDHSAILLADAELAWLRGMRGDYPGMEVAGTAVAEAARAAGEPFPQVQALAAAGFGAAFRGRVARAEELLGASADLALAEGKCHRYTVALTGLAFALAFGGRVDEARQAIADAQSRDLSWRDGPLLEWRALIAWCGGDFPDTLAIARDAVASTPGAPSKRRAVGLVFAALAAIEADEPRLAHAYLDRGAGAYATGPWHCFAECCDHAAALMAEPVDLPRLQDAAGRLEAMDAAAFAGPVLLDLAECAATAKSTEVAADAAGRLRRLGARDGGELIAGLAALAAAWACLGEGDGVAALAPATAAAAALSATGCRAFAARASDALGRARAAAGDRAGAAAAFEDAADTFALCGARVRWRRSLDALRTLGGRGRRGAGALLGPGALTPRERQVARLAADGRTARQIGVELFIGERTVETHLGNAYAKLHVRSKTDLIRRAGELSL